jgi:hypothetical protein
LGDNWLPVLSPPEQLPDLTRPRFVSPGFAHDPHKSLPISPPLQAPRADVSACRHHDSLPHHLIVSFTPRLRARPWKVIRSTGCAQADWGMGCATGPIRKCRIVRQYHVHDCTMTGGRCANALPRLTALILPRLRPLADPTSPVAPYGGNGPIVIVRVRRGQWEKCRVVRPCRIREA